MKGKESQPLVYFVPGGKEKTRTFAECKLRIF